MSLLLPVSTKSELCSSGEGDGIFRARVMLPLVVAFTESEISVRILEII